MYNHNSIIRNHSWKLSWVGTFLWVWANHSAQISDAFRNIQSFLKCQHTWECSTRDVGWYTYSCEKLNKGNPLEGTYKTSEIWELLFDKLGRGNKQTNKNPYNSLLRGICLACLCDDQASKNSNSERPEVFLHIFIPHVLMAGILRLKRPQCRKLVPVTDKGNLDLSAWIFLSMISRKLMYTHDDYT